MVTAVEHPIAVSVIIPTVGRPTLLKRAINSCLYGKHALATEVIVVPNGADDSWPTVRNEYAADPRVRFEYSPTPDQNVARNLGIKLARGELVRFLDDDDYLFPEAASAQYAHMLLQDLDFCSAGATLTDQHDKSLGELPQPETDSPEIAALSRKRLQLPFTHVYRRNSIGNLRWPVGVRQSEDIVWLIRYATAAPRRWKRMDASVGAWYQHAGHRQSLDKPSGVVHEVTAKELLDACSILQAQGRWSDELATVVAEALWAVSHRAFPFHPRYWTNIATQAMRLDTEARPDAPVYRYPVLHALDPRALMWLLLPKRLVSLSLSLARGALFGRDYRRTL